MTSTKRRALRGALAASPLFSLPAFAQSTALKISHQFPGGSATEGDFRDQLCRRFADGIGKKTNSALTAQIFPGSSLEKHNNPIHQMTISALDMSLVPVSYDSG